MELCHWLLKEPTGKCRSVFAPAGEVFEDFVRIGPAVISNQFLLPLVYAVRSPDLEALPSLRGREILTCQNRERASIQFSLDRDDTDKPGPAFAGMDTLKIATLISELSSAIAQWVEAVGCEFVALQFGGEITIQIRLEEKGHDRALALIIAGLEMMAYARGLKCARWEVS